MFDRYTDAMLAGNLAPSSVRLYLNRLLALQAEHPDLLAVTREDLEAFLAARRETHQAETRKTFRAAFVSFYGWAEDTERIPFSPAARLKPIKVTIAPPSVADDLAVELGVVDAPVDELAMILLARFGCLRLSEITTLHTSSLRGTVLRFTGKGEKQRLVPITNLVLLQALRTLAAANPGGYFFLGSAGAHCSRDHVYRVIKRRTGYNPHALRHAGATAAYEANPDLESLRIFLGHSSIATTQRYLHVKLSALQSVASSTAFVAPVTPLFTRPASAGDAAAA